VTKLAIADTTFARVDMARAALNQIDAYREQRDDELDLTVERTTVPGIKDLPAASKRLVALEGCDLVMALGQVGPEEIDKQCAHEATLGIQQAQLATDTHVLEVFVHTDEADEPGRLRWLAENRAREHAVNAMWMLFEPERLREQAGTGQREGYADEGPISVPADPPKEADG
jgi:riboflavin synthase